MRKFISSIITPVLLVTLSSGCLWAPELDRVRQEIENQIPGARFHREFAISLGPISLGIMKTVAKFAPVDDEARIYLKEIRKMRVAIYEVENVPSDVNLEIPERLQRLVSSEGWEIAAKLRDDGEAVWVLYRSEEGAIEEMYVIVMGRDELVLVRVEGKLDRLFEKAMAEHVDFRR